MHSDLAVTDRLIKHWEREVDGIVQHLWGVCSGMCHGLAVGGVEAKINK